MTIAAIGETDQLHNLGSLDRIPPGEGRAYRVNGVEIAVFRMRRGEVYAVQASCPHAGGPLADGLIGGRRVICPLHGHAFDLETGASLRDSCPALRTYSVTLSEAGELLLRPPHPNP